jgi:hypothetical protein
VIAMKAHPGSVDVQQAGCGALLYIGRSDVKIQKRIRVGAVSLVEAALNSFPEALEMQVCGEEFRRRLRVFV